MRKAFIKNFFKGLSLFGLVLIWGCLGSIQEEWFQEGDKVQAHFLGPASYTYRVKPVGLGLPLPVTIQVPSSGEKLELVNQWDGQSDINFYEHATLYYDFKENGVLLYWGYNPNYVSPNGENLQLMHQMYMLNLMAYNQSKDHPLTKDPIEIEGKLMGVKVLRQGEEPTYFSAQELKDHKNNGGNSTIFIDDQNAPLIFEFVILPHKAKGLIPGGMKMAP